MLEVLEGFHIPITMQSSANSLVLDSTQAGKSFMNSRKSNGPSTVP